MWSLQARVCEGGGRVIKGKGADTLQHRAYHTRLVSLISHRRGSQPRPPLSKKLFPVGRVGKKLRVRRSGFFIFFLILFFLKLECTGGKVKKKVFFFKDEKKCSSGPF